MRGPNRQRRYRSMTIAVVAAEKPATPLESGAAVDYRGFAIAADVDCRGCEIAAAAAAAVADCAAGFAAVAASVLPL